MKRTDSYVFTFHPDSVEDQLRLEAVKKSVTSINQTNKLWAGYGNRPKTADRFRVVLKGRLGENNPNAHKYKGKYIYSIKKADAAHFDVYIHKA